MKKYIIKYKTKINGKFEVCYHRDIISGVDGYVEDIVKDKAKAKGFFDKEQAEKVLTLFKIEIYHTGKIISK